MWEKNKKEWIHRFREQTYGYWGKGWGKEVWECHVHTVIFKMDNQQGPTVEHKELCSKLCNNSNGKRI